MRSLRPRGGILVDVSRVGVDRLLTNSIKNAPAGSKTGRGVSARRLIRSAATKWYQAMENRKPAREGLKRATVPCSTVPRQRGLAVGPEHSTTKASGTAQSINTSRANSSNYLSNPLRLRFCCRFAHQVPGCRSERACPVNNQPLNKSAATLSCNPGHPQSFSNLKSFWRYFLVNPFRWSFV